MSKVKKIAEDFLAKYPALFSANFEANKKSLDQIAVIRNRALRNQIAGAIAAMASDSALERTESGHQLGDAVSEQLPETPEAPSSGAVAQEA